jgi:hypothetical protein
VAKRGRHWQLVLDLRVRRSRRAHHGVDGVATGHHPRQRRRDASRGAEPETLGGQRHEVIEADRLVVCDVVDRAGRGALGGQRERGRHVVDVHDVPQVLARADHRETSRLAQARDQLVGIPAAGPVDVRRADHDGGQPRRQHKPLALLLGAAVGRLHRQGRLLAQQRTVRIARDDRGGEHEARARRAIGARERRTGVQQSCRAGDVRLAQLALAALRGDLRREVHDALRPHVGESPRQARAVAEIARHRLRSRRL